MAPPPPSDGAPGREPADVSAGGGRLAHSALRGTAWTAASQLSGKLLFFLSTIVLARLLDQTDFGVAAYASTVITLFSAVIVLAFIGISLTVLTAYLEKRLLFWHESSIAV